MTDRLNCFAASFPALCGTLFLGLGLLTLIWPAVLEYYSIGVGNASARTGVRAMIGGGEVGIGIVLLCGHQLGFSLSQRCTLAATIFISVGLVRLASAWVEAELLFAIQPLREAALELFLGFSGLWAKAHIEKKIE